jgi:hypothetical protein
MLIAGIGQCQQFLDLLDDRCLFQLW